jgi:hypothetical protein
MTDTPKLVIGHIVCIGPDDEEGIPYDEAVIHFEGDEDSEISIHCPGAFRLAPLVVTAVNNHASMVKALSDVLDAFGGYATPEMDAAITAMQALGLDRWSMQASMEKSEINANVDAGDVGHQQPQETEQ